MWLLLLLNETSLDSVWFPSYHCIDCSIRLVLHTHNIAENFLNLSFENPLPKMKILKY